MQQFSYEILSIMDVCIIARLKVTRFIISYATQYKRHDATLSCAKQGGFIYSLSKLYSEISAAAILRFRSIECVLYLGAIVAPHH